MKTYSVFHAIDGAKIEAVGGLLNRWGSAPTDRATVPHPCVLNNNSHVSIIAATNGPSTRSWVPMVKDTQAETVKTWTMDQFPNRGWDNNIILPLYASYDPAVIPQVASVTSFTLINTDTQQPVAGFDPISEGAEIDFTRIGTTHLSIRANTFPQQVGSVVFDYDGKTSYFTDSAFPYALAGNGAEDNAYLSWTPTLGEHTLTATPYAGVDAASGVADIGATLHFTVTNSVQNLAVGKPVTATSAQAAHPAALAVDDDAATRWVAQSWPVWLEVDLGKVYLIEKTQLLTHQSRSYKYKIEVSTDGTTYQQLNKTTATTGEGVHRQFCSAGCPLRAGETDGG